ncbi:M23 family metallopeptidase [Dokdonia sp. Hel_I_53]|uniref:M23 family metallopeptidase n=1 Tax=Dokdonia sp. Hel_I_53 TaxID=1566287 RepID=UPI00119A1955|nr:M23 family metallopeptidase [Dokdonia sp. Hel_I_53]TVZ51823.1 peptidase M23-like protein [Dokdonia sp. Hel_I_53]
MRSLFILFFILVSGIVFCQEIPKNYFVNPLDGAMIIAGTFGELRSNHFHSGLDLKTERREGLPVYASASGIVTRIKISHYGYGKAIYILHPNGYTTVYAHLKNFCPEIEDYVKAAQYKKESFEIELFPTQGELRVSKGEIIAYSGNTGGSAGPHLHFEIRDKNARPMNPLLFGLVAKDTRKPIIQELIAYPIGNQSAINKDGNPTSLRLTQKKDGNYQAESVNATGTLGFAVGTIDQLDLANNKNGIYSITTTVNGETNFEIKMNKFSFAETRYLNRMIDYGLYKDKRKRVQKLFIEKNNPLSIYTKEKDNGLLNVSNGLSYQYHISLKDFEGNETKITIPITGTNDSILSPRKIKETEDYVYSDQGYSFNEGKFEVYIPKGALYDDTFINLTVSGDKLFLHEDVVPVHKNIIVSYDLSDYKEDDREKLYLGRHNWKDDIYYVRSRIVGDKLQIGTRTFGTYSLAKDTAPPKIEPKNFKKGKWMSKYRYLTLKISDQDSGIKGYRATVNGKFILLEYDPKTNILTHDFNDGIIKDVKNDFKLVVTDNVGNSAIFETTFFRKDIR